jgi:redox-sensitive bicupin YhaK (pirin superfamily)
VSRSSRRHFLRELSCAGAFTLGSIAGVAAALPPRIIELRRPRAVKQHVQGSSARVGRITAIRRTIGSRELAHVDPFVFLDAFDMKAPPGFEMGLAPHPHRGIETVSVILDGQVGHRDSLGNEGLVGPGGVQWMTAGAGIIHDEDPDKRFFERGGLMRGFQLWVNLPARLKMTPARYQNLAASGISTRTLSGVVARVIAGRAHGMTAATTTHTPLLLVHYTLPPGGAVTLPLPLKWNAFAQVAEGTASFEARRATPTGQLVVFGRDGDAVHFSNPGRTQLQVLLGAGLPFDEPIVARGPFVMNSQAEIRQAYADYRAGRMGFLAP